MQNIKQCIGAGLLADARRNQRMTLSLRTRLATPIAEHCWAGGIHGSQLVLITDEGDYAVRLRYHQHEIIKQINEEFRRELARPLTRMRVKIAMPSLGPHPRAPRPVLSARSAEQIASTAAGLEDQALREALLRLARRGGSAGA